MKTISIYTQQGTLLQQYQDVSDFEFDVNPLTVSFRTESGLWVTIGDLPFIIEGPVGSEGEGEDE